MTGREEELVPSSSEATHFLSSAFGKGVIFTAVIFKG